MFRLLHIEDDPMDVRLVEEAMRECSVAAEVRVAPDGVAGLEVLRDSAGAPPAWRPDLILCDLRMPRMDGLGFLREVQGDPATRGIPVIILSSSAEPHDIALACALHASCFLRKPATFAELCVLVRRMDEVRMSAPKLPALRSK